MVKQTLLAFALVCAVGSARGMDFFTIGDKNSESIGAGVGCLLFDGGSAAEAVYALPNATSSCTDKKPSPQKASIAKTAIATAKNES